MTTFAGAGDPSQRRGVAIHLYAADTSMNDSVFCNIDGDLCIVPEKSELLVRTELGIMQVAPGEICVIPRGIRFAVDLMEVRAVVLSWSSLMGTSSFPSEDR